MTGQGKGCVFNYLETRFIKASGMGRDVAVGEGLVKCRSCLNYVHFNIFGCPTFGIGVCELHGHNCIWQLIMSLCDGRLLFHFAMSYSQHILVLCVLVNMTFSLLYLKKVLEIFSFSWETCK
jgi:hypothetical protein